MSPAKPVKKHLEAPCWSRHMGSCNVPQYLTNSCQNRLWVMQKQLFHWGKPSAQFSLSAKMPSSRHKTATTAASRYQSGYQSALHLFYLFFSVTCKCSLQHSLPAFVKPKRTLIGYSNSELFEIDQWDFPTCWKDTGAQPHLLKFTFQNLSRGRKHKSWGTAFVSRKSDFAQIKYKIMRQERECGQKIAFGRREQWVHPYAWVFIFISSCHYINIEAISAATMRSLIPNHLLPSCYTGHMNRDFCYSCWPQHQVELCSELDCWLQAASYELTAAQQHVGF